MTNRVALRVCRTLLGIVLIGAGAGCAHRADLEQVPIGTRVEVTRADGGVIQGTLTERNDRTVRLMVGSAEQSVPLDQIVSAQVVEGATAPPLPPQATFREFTLPAGTVLSARLDSAIGSDTSRVNDPVRATLTEAVRVDGVDVLPTGSVLTGIVTTAEPSGKVKGRASLAVHFQTISAAGRTDTYALSAGLQHTAASTKGDDAKKIGIPAAGGGILGAILGGKKGAAIGAAIGGGAGAAVVVSTPGNEVRIAEGTTLSLPLDQALDIRVPIAR